MWTPLWFGNLEATSSRDGRLDRTTPPFARHHPVPAPGRREPGSGRPVAPRRPRARCRHPQPDLERPQWEIEVDLALSADVQPAPVAVVSPDQLDVQMFAGSTHTETLTLSNTGGSDLVWDTAIMAAIRSAPCWPGGRDGRGRPPGYPDPFRESDVARGCRGRHSAIRRASWCLRATAARSWPRMPGRHRSRRRSAGPFLMTRMLGNPEITGLYVLQSYIPVQ